MLANHPGKSILCITFGVLLGSCTAKPVQKPVVVVPPPVVTVITTPTAAPVPQNWRDAPITGGDWHWSRQSGASVASFDTAAGAALFSLTCNAADRSLALRLTTSAPGGGGGNSGLPLTVTTTGEQRVLSAAPVEGSGEIGARLPAGDPLLDAMAFSRGRFMVEAPGAPLLILPAWTEVSRVIEDCR